MLCDKNTKKVDAVGNTTVRLQVLEDQLRQTLERSFKNKMDNKAVGSSSETDNSDEKVTVRNTKKDKIEDKFETYVRTVRIYSDPDKNVDDKNLFTSCFLVGLMGKTPYIKFKFPKNVSKKNKDICNGSNHI